MGIEIVAESRGNAPAIVKGDLSRAEFDSARNKLVVACANFGTIGSCGQPPVAGDEVVSVDDPDFYVVEDQYSDERRLIVEPLRERVSPQWLEAVASAVEPSSEWDILVRLGGGIDLIVSPGRIRVFGFRPMAIKLDAFVEELHRFSTS